MTPIEHSRQLEAGELSAVLSGASISSSSSEDNTRDRIWD